MSKNKRIIARILAGTLAGTATSILLAPRSGRQTQHIIATKVLRAGRAVRSLGKNNRRAAPTND